MLKQNAKKWAAKALAGAMIITSFAGVGFNAPLNVSAEEAAKTYEITAENNLDYQVAAKNDIIKFSSANLSSDITKTFGAKESGSVVGVEIAGAGVAAVTTDKTADDLLATVKTGEANTLTSGRYAVKDDSNKVYFFNDKSSAETFISADAAHRSMYAPTTGDDTATSVNTQYKVSAENGVVLEFDGYEKVTKDKAGKDLNTLKTQTVNDKNAITGENLPGYSAENLTGTELEAARITTTDTKSYYVAKYTAVSTEKNFAIADGGTITAKDGEFAPAAYSIGKESAKIELPVPKAEAGKKFLNYTVVSDSSNPVVPAVTLAGSVTKSEKVGHTDEDVIVVTIPTMKSIADAGKKVDYNFTVEANYEQSDTYQFDAGSIGTLKDSEKTQLRSALTAYPVPTLDKDSKFTFVGWTYDNGTTVLKATDANLTESAFETAAAIQNGSAAKKYILKMTAVYSADAAYAQELAEQNAVLENNLATANTQLEAATAENTAFKDAIIKSAKVAKSSVSVKKGKKANVTVTIGAMSSYKVKSSNAKIAKATKSGSKIVIKGVKKGSAKVTVTFTGANGVSVKKTIKVSVK